ncbi:recombinase family protein [Roseivivax halotolerans]|uniref:recombinase family protein n=1 Tax=Roseivivax halotolerans TaxID=93684 RepID=UPI000B85721A|nr:recombinase family protein [Roseivivax halotolerans]
MTAQGRVFAYVRVSTIGQTVAGQLQEIAAAGFQPPEYRVVSETISGSVPAMQRPEFARLVDRLEPGDILVVSKLDRLGRDAIDVTETVSALSKIPVRVHCLALGGTDLTSSSGQLTMNVLNAVAQFERDLLRERTNAGLAAAKAKGQKLGRPRALSETQETEARHRLERGESVSSVARHFDVARATIIRLRNT